MLKVLDGVLVFLARRGTKRGGELVDRTADVIESLARWVNIRTESITGLDLVEVAPDARPPVVRMMDYGKYKYEQKKKEQASKRKQHHVQVKEVRVRPKIAEHDIQVKVRKARKFLEDGDKVQINCLFRGREMAHKEVAHQVLKHVFACLEDIAKIERHPHLEGRRMVMLVTKK